MTPPEFAKVPAMRLVKLTCEFSARVCVCFSISPKNGFSALFYTETGGNRATLKQPELPFLAPQNGLQVRSARPLRRIFGRSTGLFLF